MKFPLMILAGMLSLHCSGTGAEQPRGGGHGPQYIPADRPAPSAVAMTDAQLLALRGSAKFGGLAPKDQKRETWDLESHSEYIGFDGSVTLVPKGSVLHVPDNLRANMAAGISGKFVLWNEFSGKYRGLVTRYDVTIEQASGAKPLDEVKLAAAKRQGLIVVAVLNGNPISVNPYTPATAANSR